MFGGCTVTDRELLELAAKAYWGDEIDDVVSVEWSDFNDGILYTHGDNQDHNGSDRTYRWNPLEEDADALQLAVKLKIPLQFPDWSDAVRTWGPVHGDPCDEDAGGDLAAATRRAIVRAAAEIGKALAPTPPGPSR